MAKDMLTELQKRVAVRMRGASSATAPGAVAAAGDPLSVFDANTWLVLLTTVVDLLSVCLKERGKNVSKDDGKKQMVQRIKSPQMVQRLRLRSAVLRHLGRNKDNRKLTDQFVEAVFAVGTDAEPTDVAALLDEVLK